MSERSSPGGAYRPSAEPLSSGVPPPSMRRQTSAPSAHTNGSSSSPYVGGEGGLSALQQWRRDSLEGMKMAGTPSQQQHQQLLEFQHQQSGEGGGSGVYDEVVMVGSGFSCKECWHQVFNSIVYGAINSIACVPCLYGYAQIVFGHEVYAPFMPMIAKLFILSSLVHQVCFSLFSSLPYAVGQVQDAGLIFLSHIATSIAIKLRASGESPETITATALIVINLGTALLGVALVALGRLKLARMVSYLPMPVIGGQIVFVAAICFRAGIALSVGYDLDSLRAWASLYDEHLIILLLPGLLAGAVMSWVSRALPHPLALPATMILTAALFYAALAIGGTTMDEARKFGWLGSAKVPASAQDSLSLYRLEEVQWRVLPMELPTWLGMVFVVAFSSCLDIVAIEMDGGGALNKNHELTTVGASNVVAGLLGGFTGSYIFSQTIFTYRTRTTSRLCGWVLVAAEAAVFLANVDFMSLIPLYFFAATLHFITIELMIEWLWEVRRRMTPKEYLVLWVTFLGNLFLGIIEGFSLGIVCSTFMFTISYAKASARAAQPAFQRSRVVRHRSVRRLLDQRGRILTLELSGAIFFGSSSDTLVHIKSLLGVASSPSQVPKGLRSRQSSYRPTKALPWWSRFSNWILGRPPQPQHHTASLSRPTSQDFRKAEKAALLGAANTNSTSSTSSLPPDVLPTTTYDSLVDHHRSSSPPPPPPAPPTVPRPRFLVLDFRRVTAIDMSAVTNCFLPLQALCRDLHVVLVYCDCNQRVEFYLRSNRLIDDTNTHLIPTLHGALDFCETQCILEEALDQQNRPRSASLSTNGGVPITPDQSGHHHHHHHGSGNHHHHMPLRARAFSLRGAPHLTVSQVLRTLLAIESTGNGGTYISSSYRGGSYPQSPTLQQQQPGGGVWEEGGSGSMLGGMDLESIEQYVKEEEHSAGSTIFYPEEPADRFYLVLCGEVALESAVEGEGAGGMGGGGGDGGIGSSFVMGAPSLGQRGKEGGGREGA